jgi:hypothetical protein
VRLGGRELPIASELLDRVAGEERRRYLARRAELAPLPPTAERSAMTEKAWQAQVVALATRLGWWVYHPKLSRWSEQGYPDLTLMHEGRGRALWLELKKDDGQLTEKQVAVVDRMRACGLEVEVLRPWHGLERVAEVLSRG